MQYLKFIFGVLFGLSILANVLFIRSCNSVDYKASNSALISGDSSREVINTVAEFQTHQRFADNLAKVNNIYKTKFITKYLQLHLTASDSLIIANTFKPGSGATNNNVDSEIAFDTLNIDVRFFDKETPCFYVSGISYTDTTLIFTNYNTNINLYLYWSYNKPTFLKRILTTKGGISIFDFSKYNDAISISSCSNDTISIQKNILILKK